MTYYVFDLLYLNGYDLTKTPLTERKTLLARTIAPGATICGTSTMCATTGR